MITRQQVLEPFRHPLLTALMLVLAGCNTDLTQPGPTAGTEERVIDPREGHEPRDAAARRFSFPEREFDDVPLGRGRQIRRPMP
jgi:hypothetical protein